MRDPAHHALHRPTTTARRGRWVQTFALFLSLCACTDAPRSPSGAASGPLGTDAPSQNTTAAGEVRLMDERAWAITGDGASLGDVPLVLRVAVGEGPVAAAALQFETDQGEPLVARLYRIGIDDGLPPRAEARWRGFLSPLGRWRAEPLLPDADATAVRESLPRGSWIAVLTLPERLPRFIARAGSRCDLQPLEASGPVIARGHRALDSAAARTASAIGPGAAGDAARLLAQADSPLERWRTGPMLRALAALPGGALNPAGEGPNPVGRVRVERAEVDPLEALARQATARWQAALGAIALTTPAVAEGLAERLLVFVRAPGPAKVVPAWPGEESGLAALLAALLDEPDPGPRASEWLAALPEGGAWIIDDSGSVDP
ncbi:MAG: hypothetical protein ACT4PL_06500, partial [Phycisphaerales bacterium]